MAVWIQSFGVDRFDLTPKCHLYACPESFSTLALTKKANLNADFVETQLRKQLKQSKM
ncbi:hypothetical protein GCM10007359_08890 [Rothia aerolata]|uniref:Uncharacterized protein n=1 Tax=Rothia aerolata TaxID=1812262 RepID=A0A917MSB5_9MICC|nr:hypothetical protein GCM10007359_08890 [Rothia aerolata]